MCVCMRGRDSLHVSPRAYFGITEVHQPRAIVCDPFVPYTTPVAKREAYACCINTIHSRCVTVLQTGARTLSRAVSIWCAWRKFIVYTSHIQISHMRAKHNCAHICGSAACVCVCECERPSVSAHVRANGEHRFDSSEPMVHIKVNHKPL